RGQSWVANFRTAEQWTWLWVTLAEQQKIFRVGLRENANVGLHAARRKPCRITSVAEAARRATHLAGVFVIPVSCSNGAMFVHRKAPLDRTVRNTVSCVSLFASRPGH